MKMMAPIGIMLYHEDDGSQLGNAGTIYGVEGPNIPFFTHANLFTCGELALIISLHPGQLTITVCMSSTAIAITIPL